MQDFGSSPSNTYSGRAAYAPKPIGWLPIPVGVGKMFYVQGGPFDAFQIDSSTHSLCLEVRSDKVKYADDVLDIPDFSTPEPEELEAVLLRMIDKLYEGFEGYIGCRGGIGRTGLAMACLVKAFGIREPVAYVRRNYLAHAVETPDQRKFVDEFDTTRLKRRIRYNRLRAFFK